MAQSGRALHSSCAFARHGQPEARALSLALNIPERERDACHLLVIKGPQATPQEHGHDVEVQLIDEPLEQRLANDGRPTDDLDVPIPGATRACVIAAFTPVSTKVKVRRSSCFGGWAGGCVVTTKIGTWNS